MFKSKVKIIKGESGILFATMSLEEYQKREAMWTLFTISSLIAGLILGLVVASV